MSIASIRRSLNAGELHTLAASVQLLENQKEHFDVNAEGDVVVSCVVHHGGAQVWANLGLTLGGSGRGVWQIPDVGTEVMLGTDSGEFEGELYLLACFSSGSTPSGLEPRMILIIDEKVEIRSKDGTARKLAFQDDLNALEAKHNSHTHQASLLVATTGTAAAQTGTATGTTDPTLDQVESSIGTDVLVAE